VNLIWKTIAARARREEGVSLVELLIGISITVIIVVPLVGAIYFGFRTTNDTQTRLFESGKAGLMSSFFVPDVDNAVTAQKNAMETAAACGTPRSAPVNLLLTAADGTSVSYYRGSATVAGENTKYLYRKACAAGASSVQPVIVSLAPTLPSNGANPTFNCAPTTDCVTLPWKSVSVQLSQQDANAKNQYTTTIQAAKRVT
jgi:hypothetical protein